jgi:hypothetical protein
MKEASGALGQNTNPFCPGEIPHNQYIHLSVHILLICRKSADVSPCAVARVGRSDENVLYPPHVIMLQAESCSVVEAIASPIFIFHSFAARVRNPSQRMDVGDLCCH